nr:O-methyltransferase [uncultured bacterium]
MTTTTPEESANATAMRELGMSLGFAAQVRAAAKLGVADVLGDAPATAEVLAKAIDADADTLDRLLRALTSHGVFEEVEHGTYAHTATSRLLREDHPKGMRYIVLWASAPWTWEAWPRLDEAVRTGKAVFPEIYGQEFFTYLQESDPESAKVFNRAMTQSSQITSELVADVLDLAGVRTVVDVGGGQGHLVSTLLRRHAGVKGVLYDLTKVVAGAIPAITAGGELADRCTVIGGDCRESVPAGADLYVFKNVLEWDDDSSLAALRNARQAGRPGGRVVLVQNLVEASSEMKVTTAMDLFLLLNVGGKKHTRYGLARLFEQAGLRPGAVEPVPGTSLHTLTAYVPEA